MLANTVNGTTYVGIRARTTGAPQNHWFGPSGDPRGAGEGLGLGFSRDEACLHTFAYVLIEPAQDLQDPSPLGTK